MEANTIEDMETWLAKRAYWEKFLWKIGLESESISGPQLEDTYRVLLQELGLETTGAPKEEFSFKNQFRFSSEAGASPEKYIFAEIKGIENVNALDGSSPLKFCPSLTLIYGGNGSGKSGIGRLLANACFCRGERELLPNVKLQPSKSLKARAVFVLCDANGIQMEIAFVVGLSVDVLKRFSVFDSKSVVIHLDKSNRVNFTPSQIRVFDKVTDAITKLEKKLTDDRLSKAKENPFQMLFVDRQSQTATFCLGIDSTTSPEEFLKVASFDDKADQEEIADLKQKIDEKSKLDVAKTKAGLKVDREDLKTLRTSLELVADNLSQTKAVEINNVISKVIEKKTIIRQLGTETFNDGIFKKIGSDEWRALIVAAKSLKEAEEALNGAEQIANCLLCHQPLEEDAKSLYERYWKFLESKAEVELADLTKKRTELLDQFRLMKAQFPKLAASESAVKVLQRENPALLSELKLALDRAAGTLDRWLVCVEALSTIDSNNVQPIEISKIEDVEKAIKTREDILTDPSNEILELSVRLADLEDKKKASSMKQEGIDYISYLKWQEKSKSVNFAGVKMAITKKRTEFVLVGIVSNYKTVFNKELGELGCDAELVLHASGEGGNTVKEYKLEYAEDYDPSQILSEGEQNACSLADFLTETQLDKNNCGIFLDDPVTSLDHQRKEKIARRLALEADRRQVVIFSHDLVFLSQLTKYAYEDQIPCLTHWMKKVNGIPGIVEENSTPKFATLASRKEDYQEALKEYDTLNARERKSALVAGFDYLRSACEALIEEVLFAGTIERYNDQVKVQNIEEAIFDKPLALRIVDLHGKISEKGFMHNRSNYIEENPVSKDDFDTLRSEFEKLEAEMKSAGKLARKEREIKRLEKKQMPGFIKS